MTRRSLFVLLTCCAVLLCARDSHAQPEGQPCEAEPTDQLIAYGTLLAPCQIGFIGDSDLFRFHGSAGELVSIRVADQSGSILVSCAVELLRPVGTVMTAVAHGNSCEIRASLDASGLFTIRATEQSNDSGMPYSITLDRLFPTSPTAPSINPGDVITGARIDPVGDSDLFVFNGISGDLVSLRLADTTGSILVSCEIELFGPDGTLITTVAHGNSCIVERTLEQDGVFTVRLTEQSDDSAMGYNFDYQCLVGSCPTFHTLSIDRSGLGRVTSNPAGIDCGPVCVARYFDGSVVGLTATPDPGWTFGGWTGDSDCADSAVTMNGDRHCIATFTSSSSTPTAVSDAYSTGSGTTLVVPAPGVLANDHANGGGAMSAVLVTSTAHGSLALNASGGFSYVPAANFAGSDTFTYRASTASGTSNIATVTITVTASTSVQPPRNLVVVGSSGLTVKLRWERPPLGPAPTGYVLKGGLAPGQVLASIPTGSTATFFTFVAPSGSFFIRMHSLLGADESGPSNEVSLHVSVPVPPSPPENLLGMTNGSFLALAWKNTFEGGPPSNLILDVSGSFSGSFTMGAVETFTFPAVPAGTYTLAVRASNAGGTSAPSNAVTLTFPSPCSGAPTTPANFLAYKLGSTIFVEWDPPSTGPAQTGYVLNVSGTFVGSIGTAERTLSGSVGPGSYGLSVQAVNPCGASAFTPEQTIVVP